MSARKKNRSRGRSQKIPPRIVAARGSFVMTKEPGSEAITDGIVMICWSDGRITPRDMGLPPNMLQELEALHAADAAA